MYVYIMIGSRKIRIAFKEILSLLKDKDLPETDISIAEEYIKVNEYGLALEHLAEQLFEFAIPLDERLYHSIISAGNLMEIPADNFKYLDKFKQL